MAKYELRLLDEDEKVVDWYISKTGLRDDEQKDREILINRLFNENFIAPHARAIRDESMKVAREIIDKAEQSTLDDLKTLVANTTPEELKAIVADVVSKLPVPTPSDPGGKS